MEEEISHSIFVLLLLLLVVYCQTAAHTPYIPHSTCLQFAFGYIQVFTTPDLCKCPGNNHTKRQHSDRTSRSMPRDKRNKDQLIYWQIIQNDLLFLHNFPKHDGQFAHKPYHWCCCVSDGYFFVLRNNHHSIMRWNIQFKRSILWCRLHDAHNENCVCNFHPVTKDMNHFAVHLLSARNTQVITRANIGRNAQLTAV